MATELLTPTRTETTLEVEEIGPIGGGPVNGFGGNDGEGTGGWEVPERAYRTGMWLGMAAIVMLFAAFTSALVVRQGISYDWAHTALPPVLYLNTAFLVASSLTLELSRRSLREGLAGRFAGWMYATLALGLGFVAGQLVAWRQLVRQGVYLATNPSSSFFYLITGAHGVHVLGGIVALLYLALRAPSIGRTPGRRTMVDVTALYWHFLDGLWIYLLILLMVRL